MMVEIPKNAFKQALREGRQQIGFWSTIPDPYLTEILSGAGFDWLLLDSEHSPTDIRLMMLQLQAGRAGPSALIVRPQVNDPVLIKQYLDIGAQTLLLPMIQSADEARAAVSAMRYPPAGIRGVATMTRASRFGRAENYLQRAEEELCLLVQVESKEAVEQIEAIADVDGVDGIFIGPSDLAASLGHRGEPFHPKVVQTIETAIGRITATGKPAGILTPNVEFAQRCMDLGTRFTAVGSDMGLLLNGAEALAQKFSD
ncbi:aldolase/citrate lyase family protein [Pararhizobium sp. IMCC21322]|uniref:aldolase/citrate lyase family protein n=1 Tax=Pararhizobium sp. IMCC21322 TaxID=3067903 RepID=UPI0027429324|nr:aldolase/citrate lyase family protein [Pararhizobium sp. IMCC21322]